MRQSYFLVGIVLAFIGLATGLFISPMEVDAAQYSTISMEMLQSGEYLQVKHRGSDYLDKPPLLFWTAAFSYSIFGINAFAYKLFSFLSIVIGVVSVVKFCNLYYTTRIGRIAGLIFGSNIATLLITNDVRTDTFLISWCVFSVWMAAAYVNNKSTKYLVGLGVGIGLSLLSKGPIGLMITISSLGLHLIFTKQWEKIFDVKWVLPTIIAGLCILPMSVGLYYQFDLNPDKIVNNKTGVSGLYFYFWEQSFGRITGENTWRNNLGYDFFFHTFLWSFFPWITAFLAAIFSAIKMLINKSNSFLKEYFTISAIVIPFLILSLSHYKLPHYIYIVIPFASIFTAIYVSNKFSDSSKNTYLWFSQWFSFVLTLGVLCLINLWAFPVKNVSFWIVIFLIIAPPIYLITIRNRSLIAYLIVGLSTFLLMAATLNLNFYPQLIKFQASSQAGKFITEKELNPTLIYAYDDHGHGLDFYAQHVSKNIKTSKELNDITLEKGSIYLYIQEKDLVEIQHKDFSIKEIKKWPNYHITTLSYSFLNPKTRHNAYGYAYLFEINSK